MLYDRHRYDVEQAVRYYREHPTAENRSELDRALASQTHHTAMVRKVLAHQATTSARRMRQTR